MNLNRLAISLIELNPENPADLEEFKKNLLSCYNNTQGRIQNILKEACFEADAMVDQVPELQRNIIARLGVLLEQAMGSDETDISATTEQTSQVEPAREPDSIDVQHVMLSADLDADLLNEFIIENMEWATMAESAILDWEQNPGNQELLNTIFRGFHTIKGTSAFVNLDCVKDLAHQVESVLAKVRDGEHVFTRSYANLALKSLDVIKSILEQMKSSGPGQQIELPRGYQGLLESLRNFVPDEQVQEMAIPAEESMVEPEAAAPAYTKTNRGKIAKKEGEASSEQSASSNKIREQMTESTVRVKVDRLDKLLDTVGELVIAQTMVGQDNLIVSGKYHELNKKISQAGKIVRELHDLSMFLRMVPLKGTFQKMVRLTRDLSLKHGKMVSCITEGDDIEIDRNMVDMVADPLIHLIRNAVDHGIEFPEERRRAGKSENGRIYLTAGHAEGSIMLTVWDDGRGMNRQTIVNKAIQKGLIDSAERMTDQEVWQMIFLPGFSTAEKVTEVSGRGVGMDVVKQAVEALRGRIEVQTTEGQGCTFIMRMPLTMAITDGMIVKVGSQRYILPTANIHKAVRPQEPDIHTVNQRAEMLSFRDEMVPVIRLYRFFDIPDSLTDLTSGLLVVIGEGKQRCALFVDELLGQTQVVTKLLGKGMNNVPGIAGGAIMGDGTVGLILDASGIVSIARQQTNTTT
ncbi:MAG TPA: chemotaxis protein CheA [Smithella sp.]|nr:chemotaxis protein CheA [Smithella sp.]HOE31806.1 chemotaxis protein CheA [Smithella sp.]HOG09449.1 chemotaxis protein CheA [Smithella sp.]HOS13597.1 chemotaxis protein CheA [Smithella sp.]HOX97889.1 chemotaxis protein CheA [Smithella sp.]